MKQDRVLSLDRGMATKAGKCASGEIHDRKMRQNPGKAALVIVAEDASDNTKKKFRDMCKFMRFQLFYGDKDTLGHAMGKEFRASLAILDEGLQKEFENNWK